MRRTLLPVVALLCCALPAWAVRPADILPKDVKYDPAVPRPESYFRFHVGERHLYHHQLVGYLKKLAATSKRVRVEEYARSHGDRPLIMLTITAPANHERLDEVRRRHVALADPAQSGSVKMDDLPAVLCMGYGVHGNEPSASNVAALVAYHLAAGTGERHERLLREVVVLLDPCLNPDGFERFAHWANNNRGRTDNSDPEHREHREAWPGGRTNYYWFDLNRDWLPAQHPESRGRLAIYHRWKPNVVLDFHEMGTNSTYFFQPGVPRRNHPLIPAANLALTRSLAALHARALDKIGSLYFTEESFDDFYPGKGSTYPDLHGGVGILFEQASSRGQVSDSPNGKVSFPFTIRNQFATSLSSLEGTLALRLKLLEYKRVFYRDAVEQARKGAVKGYVVTAPEDPSRLRAFLELLHRHDIRAHRLVADVKANGRTFAAGSSWVVPADQPEARFVQALFETRTAFADRVFYDISAWTLPLAFNVRHAALTVAVPEKALGAAFRPGPAPARPLVVGKDDLAYAVEWGDSRAPRALHRLLAGGVKVRVATAPFRADGRTFAPGTLMVPLGIQPEKRQSVVEILQAAGQEGVVSHPLKTGLSEGGIKLGSSAFAAVPAPRVMLVTGDGVSAYEAGEVWHLLDRRLGVPLTLIDTNRLAAADLGRYSAVVMVSGTYAGVSAAAVERLKRYVDGGGTLIAIGTAIPWLNARKVVAVTLREQGRKEAGERRPYAKAAEDAAAQLISGAIFQTNVDATHPLCYGLPEGEPLPVFRNNRVILEPPSNAYSSPVVYAEKPLLSGYVSVENLKLLPGSASVAVVASGSGRVILMAENPNFRAFWHGTNRLFVNAVLFGPITRVSAGRRPSAE